MAGLLRRLPVKEPQNAFLQERNNLVGTLEMDDVRAPPTAPADKK